MTHPRHWIRRVTQLVRRRDWERDLTDEMALHVALRAAQHTADGLTPEQATRRARQQFGATLPLREESSDAWGWRWMEHAARDVSAALRALRRSPGFTAIVLVSLTLGVMLSSLAAAVVQAYLMRPLPYPAANRVFHVMYAPPGPWEPPGLSALDWSRLTDVIEYPLVSSGETFYIADRPGPALRARRVNYGIIAGVDLPMVAGRSLIEADFAPAAEPAAVVGYSTWRDRFGADPNALNRSITLATGAGRAERVRIVGVLPRDFHVGGDSQRPIDVVVPITRPPRTYYLLRLRPNVTPDVVEQRLTAAVRGVSRDLPTEWTGVHLEAAHDRYVRELRPALVGVASAAGFVLLIAVANVAVLVVLRAAHRLPEFAMRMALGATRRRVVALLAAECGAMTATAVVLGLAGAYAALRVVTPRIEAELGRRHHRRGSVNRRLCDGDGLRHHGAAGARVTGNAPAAQR
jgi:putative ABC transport system permease protein